VVFLISNSYVLVGTQFLRTKKYIDCIVQLMQVRMLLVFWVSEWVKGTFRPINAKRLYTDEKST